MNVALVVAAIALAWIVTWLLPVWVARRRRRRLFAADRRLADRYGATQVWL